MNKLVMKVNIYHLIVAVLLIANFLLRISFLEYPLIHSSRWGDGTRDYLTAHYILQFGERPLIGPYNLLHGLGINNSPLYYYLLALFLSIQDNIIFLGIVNIILQVATILAIFLIAKFLFGNLVAIASATLFGLIPDVLRQSQFIWQPNLMQPFAYLALLLLTLSYVKKNYTFLLSSWMVLVLAITIHNSAFAWLPQFLILAFVLLKIMKKKRIFYLGVIAIIILSLTALYLPVIFYYLKFPNKMIDNQAVVVVGIYNYFSNLSYNINQIFGSLSLNPVLVALLVLSTWWYLVNHPPKRIWILAAFSFFLMPIIFSSFFNKNQIHYLILCFGVFTITISEIVSKFLKFISNPNHVILASEARPESYKLIDSGQARVTILKWYILQVVIILILLKTITSNFAFLNDNLIKQKDLYTEDKQLILDATLSIQNHIFNIKQTQNFADFNFFQIISFASNPNTFKYPPLGTLFMVPLEKNLKTKLGKISDEDIYTIVQINKANYIFVACFEFYQRNSITDCTRDFLASYPDYSIVKNIYMRYPLLIFLTKRNI